MLSVSVMLISVSVVVGFKNEIRQKITGFTSPIQVMRYADDQAFESYPLVSSDSLEKQLTNYSFVKAAYPFATKACILKADDAFEGLVIKGIDANYNIDFLSRSLVEGRLPLLNGEGNKEVLITKKQADKLGLSAGEQAILFFVQDPPVQMRVDVVGVFSTGLEEIDNTFMVSDLALLRNVNDWDENIIGGYELELHDPNIDSLNNWSEKVGLGIDYSLNTYSVTQRYPQIFDWLGLLDMNIVIIMILMTAVAVVNMVTVILILILERTQLVGVLKAVGANAPSLQKIFVYNAGWFVLLGILGGNALGLGLLFLESQLHLISIPQETYYISQVPIAFTWFYFILVNVGTLLVCTAAMFIPATWVTRISPVRALRFG